MSLHLRPFWGQNNTYRRLDWVSHAWIFYIAQGLSFQVVCWSCKASLQMHSTGLVFPTLCWSCKPHSLRMRLVGLTICLEAQKGVMRKRFLYTTHSHLAYKFQHVASQCKLCAWSLCVGIPWVMALIGDTKQAMSEGKGGPVESRLTRQAPTNLYSILASVYMHCIHVYRYVLCT